MNSPEGVYGLVLALLFAIAAGLVGSFALMKRMLLASDVISHVALPGLGLAFLFGFNPLIGGAASLPCASWPSVEDRCNCCWRP